MTQKLVTIYLDNAAYAGGKWAVGSFADKHRAVEEHLQEYLSAGWMVKSIAGFGGTNDALYARGWFAVVLEK